MAFSTAQTRRPYCPAAKPSPQTQDPADGTDRTWRQEDKSWWCAALTCKPRAHRTAVGSCTHRRYLFVDATRDAGWQSDVNLFERSDSTLALLRTRAYHAVFRYLQAMAPRGAKGKFEVSIGSAWANVNNRSQSNSPHIHPGVQVAGIYYVDDGGDQQGGVRLIDPRTQASMIPVPARWTYGMGEHVRILAVPGLFVLFPAWLQHYVVGHVGARSRISVSFNVRLTFPDDDTSAANLGHAGSQASGGSAIEAPAELSFTVPPHHQQSFLDSSAAGDMRVQ